MKTLLHFFVLTFLVALFLPSALKAQNVLFVTDTLSKDQSHWYVVNYCLNNGYPLTISGSPSSTAFKNAYSKADIVLISAQAKTDSASAFIKVTGKTPIKPIVCWKRSYMKALNLMKDDCGWNEKTGYKMLINDDQKSHPLASGYSGTIEVYDFPKGVDAANGPNDRNVNAICKSSLAKSAVIIGKIPWSDGTWDVSYFAVEKGGELTDSLKAANRMVAFYFTIWTHPETCVYNGVTDKMWETAFNWALAGTETSVKDLKNNTDYLILENSIRWKSDDVKVSVFNILGQPIFNISKLNENTLDLSNLKTGLYIVKAVDNKTLKADSFKFLKR